MIILFFFFCSGATALVYEVIWSKYLALIFGSTIQAQTVVLAVFMCGLALGNKLFSRYADGARRPLAIYGYLELATGIYALCFSHLYHLADGAFATLGAKLLDHVGWLLLLKALLSILLLLGPTVLMGGTLPVLAAWLQRSTSDASRRSARFYATNSLGAVCGAALAGFTLVPWLGLRLTTASAGVVNVLIGVIVILMVRKQQAQVAAPGQAAGASTGELIQTGKASPVFLWGCVIVALTGGVSMGLEVLASRFLCLVFGASLQVFAIVLMSFILGIGLGSSFIASPRRKRLPKEVTTAALLLGAATAIGLLVWNIENVFRVYAFAQTGLSRTVVGYWYHQIMITVVSICVLSVPAAAIGSVLPLWIRVLSESSDPLGNRVGRLLTWNTLGATAGAVATGFLLMPKVGLRGSFAVLAFVLAFAGMLTALATQRRFAAAAGAVVSVFLVVVSVTGGQGWRFVLSSGVFRQPMKTLSSDWIQERRKTVDLLFYEDAADATVSVERGQSPFSPHEVTLRIDGKADASSAGDLSTQILLAQLPLMVRPHAKDVFCFGMGSGVTAGSVLGYPVRRLNIAENCDPVLRAVKFFKAVNHGVYTNKLVHIYREDARTVLKLDPQKYDVIIAEPSNPWMVGIGSVFSHDFYKLAAARLQPGGIMAQWFHVYEVDDHILQLVLRTFSGVFPYMEIWDVDGGDIVLLGSKRPWKSGLKEFRQAFELPGPRRDLAAIGLTSPAAVLARQLASQRTAFAVAGPGRIQTDNLPILEYEAPRTFYIYLDKTSSMFEDYDERTWQMDLASTEKNRALAQLDPATLAGIFGKFSSVDQQLVAYVDMRVQGSSGSASLLSIPCVFRGNHEPLVYAPGIARTNTAVRALVNAEAVLRMGSTNKVGAVETIQKVLDSIQNYHPKESGWSASYYTSLGVKASLKLGKLAEAKRILLRGLQLDPKATELHYLSRILAREGILQPSEVMSVAKR